MALPRRLARVGGLTGGAAGGGQDVGELSGRTRGRGGRSGGPSPAEHERVARDDAERVGGRRVPAGGLLGRAGWPRGGTIRRCAGKGTGRVAPLPVLDAPVRREWPAGTRRRPAPRGRLRAGHGTRRGGRTRRRRRGGVGGRMVRSPDRPPVGHWPRWAARRGGRVDGEIGERIGPSLSRGPVRAGLRVGRSPGVGAPTVGARWRDGRAGRHPVARIEVDGARRGRRSGRRTGPRAAGVRAPV